MTAKSPVKRAGVSTPYVLGIDPGFASLGLSAVRRVAGGYLVAYTAPVNTSTAQDEQTRLSSIWDHLELCAEQMGGLPELLAYEDQRQVATAYRIVEGLKGGWNASNTMVDEVVGMLKGWCFHWGVPYLKIAPKTAKVALLGRGCGNATKKAVQLGAQRFSSKRLSQAAADATAVAVAGWQRGGVGLVGKAVGG